MHTIAKALAAYLTTASLLAGGPARADWPQWRGPARDGITAPFEAKAWHAPREAVKHGQGPFATPLLAGGGALYAYGVNSVLSA